MNKKALVTLAKGLAKGMDLGPVALAQIAKAAFDGRSTSALAKPQAAQLLMAVALCAGNEQAHGSAVEAGAGPLDPLAVHLMQEINAHLVPNPTPCGSCTKTSVVKGVDGVKDHGGLCGTCADMTPAERAAAQGTAAKAAVDPAVVSASDKAAKAGSSLVDLVAATSDADKAQALLDKVAADDKAAAESTATPRTRTPKTRAPKITFNKAVPIFLDLEGTGDLEKDLGKLVELVIQPSGRVTHNGTEFNSPSQALGRITSGRIQGSLSWGMFYFVSEGKEDKQPIDALRPEGKRKGYTYAPPRERKTRTGSGGGRSGGSARSLTTKVADKRGQLERTERKVVQIKKDLAELEAKLKAASEAEEKAKPEAPAQDTPKAESAPQAPPEAPAEAPQEPAQPTREERTVQLQAMKAKDLRDLAKKLRPDGQIPKRKADLVDYCLGAGPPCAPSKVGASAQ